jgi:hypothetical protein
MPWQGTLFSGCQSVVCWLPSPTNCSDKSVIVGVSLQKVQQCCLTGEPHSRGRGVGAHGRLLSTRRLSQRRLVYGNLSMHICEWHTGGRQQVGANS